MPEKPNTTDDPDETVSPADRSAAAADDRDTDPDPVERDDTPPAAVVDAAERLTRRARDAVDEAEARAYLTDRDERLAAHDYTARVREDDTRDVLVVHPREWVEGGTIRPERIEAIERGIERPLSGPGETDDWETVEEHNRELVATVRERHGDTHGANAAALADFMGNHYAKPVESATRAELRTFLDDYFVRNAWPTDEQRSVVEKSVRLVFAAAEQDCPLDG
jgi:hypothetical protein